MSESTEVSLVYIEKPCLGKKILLLDRIVCFIELMFAFEI